MKITPLVMSLALVFLIIAGIIVGTFNFLEGNALYEDQAYRQLLSITESKAERVEDFLNNRKTDAMFLSTYEDVRDIFDEELLYDVELMTKKIKHIAEKTRDEIEAYLLAHPDMTGEDLQKDESFRKIATQRVGETGYTFILNVDDFTNFQHIEDSRINFEYETLRDDYNALWMVLKKMQTSSEGSGYYSRLEEDGQIRDKFLYFYDIPVSTKDGVRLSVGATTYLEEYGGSIQLVKDLDRELRNFQEAGGYSDLIFIDLDGNVIWTAEEHNELGTNLITGLYNESLLANVFNKVKKDLDVGISDSEVYGVGDNLNIFITAPIMYTNDVSKERELRGVVALRLNNNKIGELITTDVELGDTGEVYIVNRDRHHITLLKFDGHESIISEDNIDGFHEEVTSEGIENCFKDYNNYYFELKGEDVEDVLKTSIYFNYAEEPNRVLGAHSYILESEWCVIAEMKEEYFIELVPNLNKSMMINLFVNFIFLLAICLLLDSFFEIRRERG